MYFIDTHAHLDFEGLVERQKEVIENAAQAGVKKIINVGCNLALARQAVFVTHKFSNVYATVGIHPQDAVEATIEGLNELKKLASNTKVVAIGEIGLDYFRNHQPPKIQIEAFHKQLQLAQELALPVVIHCRDAHSDVLKVLKELKINRGVMHCFSGDELFLEQVLSLGLFISFAGNITYPKAEALRRVLKYVPIKKLLLETDCPFLPPQKFRGHPNEPAYLIETARIIAEIKNISLEELTDQTTVNANQIFILV